MSTSTPTLFQSLARSRPEWVAQGLFVHAVLFEPGVRALLLGALGKAKAISRDLVPEVDEEIPEESGWRRDVVIKWPGHDTSIELKLLAPFTSRQRSAPIDLIVARTRDGALDGVRCVTWAELVKGVADPTLRVLLEQVVESSFAMEAPKSTIEKEFDSFSEGGPEGAWPTMYQFLSTLHYCLYDAEHPNYRSSRGWSKSRKPSDAWYGYKFWVGTVDYWLGFVRDANALRFALYRDSGRQLLWNEPNNFDARSLSQRVLETVRSNARAT
jgi:hypothetical protein